MTHLLSIRNVSKTYGDDTLFHDLSIDFKENEQLGLIGVNGSGKSTFLQMIAKAVQPDTGEVIQKKGLRFVYLPQEDSFNNSLTIEQLLYAAAKQVSMDEKEQHKTVQKLLGEGGFTQPETPVSQLSGGWKKKLAVTQALCRKPDVLLLDEPTNHLDIAGILWLEKILKTADFTFVVISHDRTFLENVCSNIMEIGKYYPDGYFKITGQYNKFKKHRDLFLNAQFKKQASLSSKMRREDAWLKQGPKARTSKAKYRLDQAQKLKIELNALKMRNKSTKSLNIDFHATGRQTKKLLRARKLKKSLGNNLLFSDITFDIGPGFCLGVVGENGSGKSTFLSILEKKILPDEGSIEWAPDLKMVVFDQNRSRIDPDQTLKQALNPGGGDSVLYRNRSIHVVSWAKRFLFMPDQLDMPVHRLSGGEKARIVIANMMLTPCDIILFDEPTNDLDILSLQVLEDSIQQFPGAVVIVSHDRYLMNKVCNKILYIDPKQKADFFSNFDQIIAYRQKFKEKPSKNANDRPCRKKSKIAFSFKDKFELDHMEEHILTAEKAVDELAYKIQDPDILSDAVKMKKYCSELKSAQEKVQTLYNRWEHLEQKKMDAGK